MTLPKVMSEVASLGQFLLGLMADVKPVSPADLLFDETNPRLSQPSMGQRGALRALATLLDRKLLKLAEDIVTYGVDPGSLPIVVSADKDANRYIVLDGNRRLAALKSLENPESISGAVQPTTLEELRNLSRRYQSSPVETVRCLVVKTKEEANHWIELRHQGQKEGAGVLPWGADESSRWRARSGKVEFHTQALNFLEDSGSLSAGKRSGKWTTTFKRLIGTPEVRAKLGIGLNEGELQILGDTSRVAKALMYVVDDIVAGKTTSRTISSKEDRVKYAKNLPTNVVVPPASPAQAKATSRPAKKVKKLKPVRAKARDILIPDDCILKVVDARCAEIETELRTLSLDSYPNAISVLFRVFVELSTDVHITKKKLTGVSADNSLNKKIESVLSDLLSHKKLTKQQATPVRRACQKDSFLAPSILMMHGYVHNQHIFPAPSDLRAHWNNLQPFVSAIWSP